MRPRRTAAGKTAIVALLVAVVVIAVVAFVALSQRPGTSPFPASSSSNASTSEQSTTPSGSGSSITVKSNITGGLQLTATITPIDNPQGGNVTVVAQVYNTLSSAVTVNYTSMANPASGPCAQGFATGVEVFPYTSENSNATAGRLFLYNPSLLWICPTLVSYQYSFSPNSDVATRQGLQAQVSETSMLAGYWTGSGQNYVFQTFPPGNYTVDVFDAWGQHAIGHFQVRGPSSASAITKTFQFGKMPANFILDGYSFNMLANGTGATVNGIQYTPYTIAYQISSGTKNQTLVFGWEPPCSFNLGLPCKGDNTLIPPSPNGTVFGGHVDMVWFANASTIYLNVTTIQ